MGKTIQILSVVGLTALTMSVATQSAFGQGCIVSRSNGDVGGPSGEGGYMQAGDFSFGDGFRHQFSFRHFVGPQEQTYRIQQGTQVMNKLNLQNFNVTYQISSRFSVTADVPLMLASRHTHNSPITYTSSGIGDSSFMVNGWIWDTKENTKGNVQLGMGVLLPTGKDNLTNYVDAFDGKGPHTQVLDYSIQPGQGGWGIPLQWAAFKNIGGAQVYFNGVYTAMLQSINSVNRTGAVANPATLTQFNSISDQYLLQAGVTHAVSKVKGLTLSVGPRFEGVPARNLFPGDNLGFRRPGFALSIEPGVQYVHGSQYFSASIGRAFYRDRTRSVPDVINNAHGDAAFADYVWLASYTYRYSRNGNKMSHHTPDHDTVTHKTTAPAASVPGGGTSN